MGISQLRGNQNIEYKDKKRKLKDYFDAINQGVAITLRVRGGEIVKATVSSARLKVTAHGRKRFVIALKYEGENDYRYLVATDMTWRTIDIIQAYRRVATFATACFGHPSPSKRQKLNATVYFAPQAPIRPFHSFRPSKGIGTSFQLT